MFFSNMLFSRSNMLVFSPTCSSLPDTPQVRAATRVLQGHVALSRAVFPEGTPGLMLDAIARAHSLRVRVWQGMHGRSWKQGVQAMRAA